VEESGVGGDHVRDGTHHRGTCLGCEESKSREREREREREIDGC